MVRVDFKASSALRFIQKAARETAKAERTAVQRSAVCIRSMELAALRGNGSKAIGGKFAKMSPLHNALVGKRTGGALVSPKALRIESDRDSASVDWREWARPYVVRWQTGGTVNRLDLPRVRKGVRWQLRRKLGTRAGFDFPLVATVQPPRPFIPKIAEVARREFPRWVFRNLEKIMSNHSPASVWDVPFLKV